MLHSRLARGFGIVFMAAAAQIARADCAASESYAAEVQGNSVLLCLSDSTSNPSPWLRQASDGGVVELLGTCVSNPGSSCCISDPCVPPGTYRYGLAMPLTCNGCGGEVPNWTSVTVTSELDGGCASPDVSQADVPWPAEGQFQQCQQIEDPIDIPPPTAGCSTAGSVLGFDAGLALLASALLRARRRRR